MKRIYRKINSKIFFLALYVLGLFLVPQYPVDIDEPSLRSHGTFNLINAVRFLAPKWLPEKYSTCDSTSCFPSLENWNAYTHGAWFEMLLSLAEYIFGFEKVNQLGGDNFHNIYLMRHFLTYTFCFVGLISLFYFIKREFQRTDVAYIAVILMLGSPRIFSSMFWDQKNMVFLSTLCISFNLLSLYFKDRRLNYLILCGVFFGLSAGRRIVGLGAILVVAILLLFICDNNKWHWRIRKKNIVQFAIFLKISALSLLVSMPYLWSNPVGNVLSVVKGNANFELFNGLIWYNGNLVSPNDLPRLFLSHWILITTPLYQIIFGLISLGLISWFLFTYGVPVGIFKHSAIIAYLMFCFLCVSYVQIMNPVNYAGWFHFYFLQLAFVIVSCLGYSIGVVVLENSLYFKRASAIALLAVSILSSPTFVWISSNHPYQRSYFNILAGQQELIPYRWSESSGYGIELFALRWILERDHQSVITIGTIGNSPIKTATILLQTSEKNRLCFTDRDFMCSGDKPEYIIDTLNYDLSFGQGATRNFQKPTGSDYVEIHSWKIKKQPLMFLYKQKRK